MIFYGNLKKTNKNGDRGGRGKKGSVKGLTV